MPFVKRNEPKRDLSTTDVSKLFVGRAEQLHFFADSILAPEVPAYKGSEYDPTRKHR